MHFRCPIYCKISLFELVFGKATPHYKHLFLIPVLLLLYLGFHFDSRLEFKEGIDTLSNAAYRALGGIIATFKPLKDAGYKTFSQLYERELSQFLIIFRRFGVPENIVQWIRFKIEQWCS